MHDVPMGGVYLVRGENLAILCELVRVMGRDSAAARACGAGDRSAWQCGEAPGRSTTARREPSSAHAGPRTGQDEPFVAACELGGGAREGVGGGRSHQDISGSDGGGDGVIINRVSWKSELGDDGVRALRWCIPCVC